MREHRAAVLSTVVHSWLRWLLPSVLLVLLVGSLVRVRLVDTNNSHPRLLSAASFRAQDAISHHTYGPDPDPHSCKFRGNGSEFLWSTQLKQPDNLHGALWGTVVTQAAIWAHQNPEDCSGQKYLLHTPQVGGIGAQLHVMGSVLAVALDLGRIFKLQYNPKSTLWTDEGWCGTNGRRNVDDCFFVPLSTCQPDDTEVAEARRLRLRTDQSSMRVLHDYRGSCIKSKRRHVPNRFRSMLDMSPVQIKKQYYWWRAQSATYIVRPNIRTLRHLVDLRKQILQNAPVSLESTISVHIRHGDKWTETEETPTPTYFERASKLQREPNSKLHQSVFLSTEDPTAIEWFNANTSGWAVSYTESDRKPDRRKRTTTYARERGPAKEMLHSLLNLQLAIECGAWVCTLTSNWCRLIDELRSTVGCKANGRYLDAAQADPPDDLGW